MEMNTANANANTTADAKDKQEGDKANHGYGPAGQQHPQSQPQQHHHDIHVPAYVTRHLKHHHHTHKIMNEKKPKRSRNVLEFYCPPTPLQEWGEKHDTIHIGAQQLFFDLVLVAFTYRIGHFLLGGMEGCHSSGHDTGSGDPCSTYNGGTSGDTHHLLRMLGESIFFNNQTESNVTTDHGDHNITDGGIHHDNSTHYGDHNGTNTHHNSTGNNNCTDTHHRFLAESTHASSSPCYLPQDNVALIIPYYIAIYSIMFLLWEGRNSYEAAVYTNDVFHRILYAFEWVLVAVAALNVTTIDQMADYSTGQALAFSCSVFIFHCLLLLKDAEFVWYFWSLEERYVKIGMFALLFDFPCFIILLATVVCVAVGIDFSIVCILYFVAFFIVRVGWFFVGNFPKEYRIPVNIDYFIERYGTFAMVMLGEGVLGLILEPSTFESVYYWVIFISSYFTLAALQLIHYSTAPNKAENHPFRNTMIKANLWSTLIMFYQCALLGLSVGLRFFVGDPDASIEYRFCSLALISLGSVLVLLAVMEWTYGGTWNLIDIVAWCFRLIVAIVPFCILSVSNVLQAWEISLIIFAIASGYLMIIMLSGGFKREISRLCAFNMRIIGVFRAMLVALRWRRKHLERKAQGRSTYVHPAQGSSSSSSSSSSDGMDFLDKKSSTSDFPDKKSSLESAASRPVRRRFSLTHKNERLIAYVQKKTVRNISVRMFVGNFYQRPRASVTWSDLEAEHSTNWADLFFDLMYVALIHRLGTVFGEIIEGNNGHWNAQDMFGLWCILLVYTSCWLIKASYSARWGSNDVFHKLFDLVRSAFLASSMVFVDFPLVEGNTNSWVGFASCISLYMLGHICLLLEVYLSYKGRRQETKEEMDARKRDLDFALEDQKINDKPEWIVVHAQKAYDDIEKIHYDIHGQVEMAKRLSIEYLFVIFLSMMSILANYYHESFALKSFLISGGYVIGRIVMTGLAMAGKITKKNSSPLNLHYYLHRLKEFTMYFIGEAVLTLILVEVINSGYFYATFVLACLLLYCTNITLAEMDTSEPGKHAARHNRVYGLLLSSIREYMLYFSMLVMGISLYKILEQSDHSTNFLYSYYLIFATSSSMVLFSAYLIYLTHRSASKKKRRISTGFTQVAITIVVVIISFFIWAVLPLLPDYFVLLSFISWVVAMMIHTSYDDHISDREKMKKMTSAEGFVSARSSDSTEHHHLHHNGSTHSSSEVEVPVFKVKQLDQLKLLSTRKLDIDTIKRNSENEKEVLLDETEKQEKDIEANEEKKKKPLECYFVDYTAVCQLRMRAMQKKKEKEMQKELEVAKQQVEGSSQQVETQEQQQSQEQKSVENEQPSLLVDVQTTEEKQGEPTANQTMSIPSIDQNILVATNDSSSQPEVSGSEDESSVPKDDQEALIIA